ncbi:hypothetical protein PR048_004757 [Dryococelus australis]|uniref:Uncharacterized protein n=1 Tax=Dryococelus australis TaxID=614101 RepID=A0ABQ9I6Q1_9NEOP|nr:hypothetical protein PR048_004757 [Dryococelus australis]
MECIEQDLVNQHFPAVLNGVPAKPQLSGAPAIGGSIGTVCATPPDSPTVCKASACLLAFCEVLHDPKQCCVTGNNFALRSPVRNTRNKTEVRYLGHIFSEDGTRVDDNGVKTINELSAPGSKKGLQSLLGFINFVRKFIPQLGHFESSKKWQRRQSRGMYLTRCIPESPVESTGSCPTALACEYHKTGYQATVDKQLAHSPPTKADHDQSPAGSPDFRNWELCQTMPLVGRFSQESPISPTASFRCHSAFTSITLVGSQGFAFKSRPNFFTH